MAVDQGRGPSGWAIGWTAFAGIVLIMIGAFQVLLGIAALAKNTIYVTSGEWVFKLNVTTWGWIHLILGLVVLLAGIGVFGGQVWARTVGVVVAMLSAIAAFLWLPYYPVWAIAVIVMDVFVIWALTAHGRDILAVETDSEEAEPAYSPGPEAQSAYVGPSAYPQNQTEPAGYPPQAQPQPQPGYPQPQAPVYPQEPSGGYVQPGGYPGQ